VPVVLPGTLPLVVAVVPVLLVVPLEYVVSVIAVVRVELVVGSYVVEVVADVVVCLSRPIDPLAETARLSDNKDTDDATQIAIKSLFVFICFRIYGPFSSFQPCASWRNGLTGIKIGYQYTSKNTIR
jgi:hypothetical protein